MFVFALLVLYRGREEAIYTASYRFENTTIVLAYQHCVVRTLSRVFAPISGQRSYFSCIFLPQNIYIITKLLWFSLGELRIITPENLSLYVGARPQRVMTQRANVLVRTMLQWKTNVKIGGNMFWPTIEAVKFSSTAWGHGGVAIWQFLEFSSQLALWTRQSCYLWIKGKLVVHAFLKF